MNNEVQAALYLVSTPIGNLGDITVRAAKILREVSFIAVEDTRVTSKLLFHLNIKKPLVAYHAHNLQSGSAILDRIEKGEACALCTDAGTPAISDPGEVLVVEALERGISVFSVPGACAVAAAISVSGQPSGRFCFEGFLSTSAKARKKHLLQIKNEQRTIVFYEAPHKLKKTLCDLYDTLGERSITIVRELTKIHETITKTTICKAVEFYEITAPRGEFVLVIDGAKEQKNKSFEQAVSDVLKAKHSGKSLSVAAKEVAEETGYSKSRLYNSSISKKELL